MGTSDDLPGRSRVLRAQRPPGAGMQTVRPADPSLFGMARYYLGPARRPVSALGLSLEYVSGFHHARGGKQRGAAPDSPRGSWRAGSNSPIAEWLAAPQPSAGKIARMA